MRSVAAVATGKTRFGSFPELSIRDLARESGASCIEKSKIAPDQIEALYVGNFAGPSFVGQNHLAPYISSALGLCGVPCTRFEAACASSGSAFFHGYSAVAGGLYDLVLTASGIGLGLCHIMSCRRYHPSFCMATANIQGTPVKSFVFKIFYVFGGSFTLHPIIMTCNVIRYRIATTPMASFWAKISISNVYPNCTVFFNFSYKNEKT